MRTRNLVCTGIVILYSLLFMIGGIFLFCIPVKRSLLDNVVFTIQHRPNVLIGLGIAFFLISVIIFIACHRMYRRNYYSIKMGPLETSIDERLIHQYVRKYWQKLLPHERIDSEIEVKRNKITIHADLPYTPLEKQEELLKQIEYDLRVIFASQLGYFKGFTFSVSFQGS